MGVIDEDVVSLAWGLNWRKLGGCLHWRYGILDMGDALGSEYLDHGGIASYSLFKIIFEMQTAFEVKFLLANIKRVGVGVRVRWCSFPNSQPFRSLCALQV